MKIAIVSRVSFADFDLPLIKEMQRQGHEVYYFMELPCYQLKSTIIDIKEQDSRADVLPASTYKELEIFKNYFDFSKFYVINRTNSHSLTKETFGVYYKLYRLLKEINPDIVHTTSHLFIYNFILYKFRKRMVFTVHDPFLHSSEVSFRVNFGRKISYKLIPKLVLLNDKQVQLFKDTNKIDDSRILVSKVGKYDFYQYFAFPKTSNESHTIIFFGRISKYKGLEYLCQAFPLIKEEVPDAKLIIAGGGNIYFDISQQEKDPDIEVKNQYIPVNELANYLQNSAICVCPYTDATQSGVIITSYSMGVPVIASNVGGLSTMVEEGKGGYLVEPRNINELASKVVSLLKNNPKREEMHHYLLNAYFTGDRSLETIVKKYVDFYSKPV